MAVNAPVLCVPLTDLLPVQPPDAVQEAALVDDHVRVAAAPLFTVLGVAERLTVGWGVAIDTVAD